MIPGDVLRELEARLVAAEAQIAELRAALLQVIDKQKTKDALEAVERAQKVLEKWR